ncbi:hypothetical protein PG991_011321 [Apiospora marii]|uniref:DUF6594 domain-containing protein n=1 Tax=Apiospora marii TaxID=335849 RepID=A0ABR1RE50_9PEZI
MKQHTNMKGYAKIASFMGEQPEAAMVRRFADINLQNILYLQAEIVGLEKELRRIEADNDAHEDIHLDWYSLAHTEVTADGGEEAKKQWEKFTMLRNRLKEYSQSNRRIVQLLSCVFCLLAVLADEAVVAFCTISQLPKPPNRDVQNFKDWLERPRLGTVYLTGRDHTAWDRGEDLMCLQPSPHSHRFSGFIASYVVPVYYSIHDGLTVGSTHFMWHFFSGSRTNTTPPDSTSLPTNSCAANTYQKNAKDANGIYSFENSRIVVAANLIGTIAASVLPVLSIAVLYNVQSMAARLGIVALFSALFSTCLWYMNDGNLVEVFGATSAFAAVQVVFIGTSGSG